MSHNLGDQANILRFLGGWSPAIIQQSAGCFSSQYPFKVNRGTALWSDAQVTERCGEGGPVTGEDDITESWRGGAAANPGTVHSRDDGFGELYKHVETPLIGLLDIFLNSPGN